MSLNVCPNPQNVQNQERALVLLPLCVTRQCGFITCNTCPTLEADVDNGGGCACVGLAVCVWETCVLSSQLRWEPKTAPQNIYLKKRRDFTSSSIILQLRIWYSFAATCSLGRLRTLVGKKATSENSKFQQASEYRCVFPRVCPQCTCSPPARGFWKMTASEIVSACRQ